MDAKKRTANFSASETELLISLVKKYKSIIECMRTDTVNSKMKKEAWIKIENEFNCQSMDNPRTAVILKNKYDNIKRNVKKQYADEKTFHRGTGGGPPKLFAASSIATTVGDILQQRMTGEPSIYDSDFGNNLSKMDDNDDIIETDEEIVTVMVNEEIDEPIESNVPMDYLPTSSKKRDWTHYTPADLKSSSTLTSSATDTNVSKKKKTYQDKISCWASSRANLSKQQETAFVEQHHLKMKFMQEKHDAEQKRLAEKHELELQNLKLQNKILEQQLHSK